MNCCCSKGLYTAQVDALLLAQRAIYCTGVCTAGGPMGCIVLRMMHWWWPKGLNLTQEGIPMVGRGSNGGPKGYILLRRPCWWPQGLYLLPRAPGGHHPEGGGGPKGYIGRGSQGWPKGLDNESMHWAAGKYYLSSQAFQHVTLPLPFLSRAAPGTPASMK